ncbi:hypothetical protein VD0002_g101 [Verticillium dahliae]|uniref:Uncharacterized protein n=1 Tax=Verticillium dahliae TaxID=27337 RepID=A0A2J8BPQ1_VERDA|nr:hypothetical protein BJF96_g9932 [Verticillium dahliae]PNH56637.1 hypothetical protein VD0003_g1062 [Verticillium dahliae]PNH70610.1 hypothetical protein VD0002_g101 [Verticillium dahliae]RBQ88212.1 hypothetical protein VDGD_20657 [Verticillium dahliae]
MTTTSFPVRPLLTIMEHLLPTSLQYDDLRKIFE